MADMHGAGGIGGHILDVDRITLADIALAVVAAGEDGVRERGTPH